MRRATGRCGREGGLKSQFNRPTEREGEADLEGLVEQGYIVAGPPTR